MTGEDDSEEVRDARADALAQVFGGATPPESRIKALLFDTYSSFRLFGQEFELRLCIGITKEELQFKMEHDGTKLLELLKRHGVYPFTDLERDSVPL